jgi:hypothetical protein
MGSSDDGYVRMNAPALEAERRVLAGRPERGASLAINAIKVDAAAFGTVPGGSAAAGRLAGWVDRSRTEMDRVVTEVTDLEQRTARLRDMCLQGEADTTAAAGRGTPR